MTHTGTNSGKAACAAAFAAVAIGVCALAGWQFDLEPLKRVIPGFIAMNPASAVAFVLMGTSLACFLRLPPVAEDESPPWLSMGRLCALVVTLIGLAKLADLLGGWDLGVDHRLFASKLAAGSPLPNRMAPPTALNFLLLGGALLFVDARHRTARFGVESAAVAVGFVSLLAILGYAYHVRALYGIGDFSPMALHTAVTFLVMSVAVLLSHADGGLPAIFAGANAGGTVARRLLPAAVLVPAVLGWLTRQGEAAGIYHGDFGDAAFAVGNILVFTSLVCWSAKRLFNADCRRRKVEEVMRESEERFSGAFEHAPIGVALVSPGGRWLKVNRTLCELVGRSEAELLTGTFQDLTHPEDLAGDLENVRRLLAGEIRSYQMEKRYLHAEGHPITASLSVSLVRDGRGQPRYFVSHVQDITERERVATALRHSKRFLQSTLDALSAHIAILDEHGTIIEVNAAWKGYADGNRLQGRRRGVGDNYLQLCDAATGRNSEEAAPVASGIRAVLTGRSEEFHLEYPCHGPREQCWFIVRVTRFRGDGPVRVVVAHENVTERREAELATRFNAQRFRSLVEATSAIVWDTPASGEFEGEQPGWSAFTGQTFEELRGWGWLNAVHPDDRAESARVWSAAQASRSIYEVEQRLRTPDGAYRDMMVRAVPILDEDGTIRQWVGVHADVTEQRRAAQLLAANEALLRSFIQHAPVAIAMLDTQMRYVQTSERWMEDYHLTGQTIIGRCHYDVFPDAPQRWQEIHRRVLAGAVERCDEDPFARADGSTEWLQWEARPWHDADGGIGGLIFFTQIITERRREEEELRWKTAFLEAQVNSSLDGMLVVNAQGKKILQNQRLNDLWKIPPHIASDVDDGPQIRWVTALTKDPERFIERAAYLYSRPNETSREEIELKNGNLYDRYTAPVVGRDGKHYGRIWLFRDITEQRRAEESVRVQAHMLNNIGQAVIATEPDGQIIYVNRRAEELYGWAPGEMPGRNLREVTAPQTSGEQAEAILAHFQRGENWSGEFLVQRRDGTRFPVLMTDSPLRDRHGEVIGRIGISEDITARKHVEEELYQSRETLRRILDNVPQRVFWKDRDLVYQGCNRALALDMGFNDPGEVIGKTDFEASWKTQADAYRADDRSVIERNEAKISFEEALTAADGLQKWVRSSKVPLHDLQGRVTGVLCTYEDVTAHKLANLEIERLNADLEQRVAQRTEALFAATRDAERANQAKTEFLSRTSHELRTPMNAILGFGQLLELEDDLNPEARESVEQILKAGRHLLNLIDEVLDISNAESGSIVLALAPVAVTRLVEETLGLVRSLGTACGVNLELASSPEAHGSVLADPQRLRQVLLNLLSNAIKYNRPGGRVTVECARVEGASPPTLRLNVKDTGMGISAENLNRLFTPFDRLDAERTQTHIAGTGLGLAVSKRMVELMGGALGVESAPGEGSTFWIELPLAAGTAESRLFSDGDRPVP